MLANLPVFVLTTGLLAMLPGVGQALMVRQTLHGGLRTAWASVAGTCTGLLIWTTAAAVGLSAVLTANPGAYTALRVGGGLILAVLGAATLWSVRKTAPAKVRPERRFGPWGAYAVGLATNLGNPKAGVFAVSLLPQFITPDGPVLAESLVLGVTWAVVTGSWYLLFTWAVDRGRVLMARPAVQRRVQLATGGVLIVLGAAVAAGA
ncbi:LysE family translocator [Phytomonospora sp. NPDC050363]|uniref:LysE family translocator n=1 Tax=Phytomonospora sp. NPDC050363 TaxID=3155642 RepID=UPI0033FC09D6